MNNLESLKNRGQASVTKLVDLGKQQPEQVQTWGVTAVAALAGAVALTAVAKGVLGIVGTLAYPPVALTVGALGGGLFGWSFMQGRPQAEPSAPPAPAVDVVVGDVPISGSELSTATNEPV